MLLSLKNLWIKHHYLESSYAIKFLSDDSEKTDLKNSKKAWKVCIFLNSKYFPKIEKILWDINTLGNLLSLEWSSV